MCLRHVRCCQQGGLSCFAASTSPDLQLRQVKDNASHCSRCFSLLIAFINLLVLRRTCYKEIKAFRENRGSHCEDPIPGSQTWGFTHKKGEAEKSGSSVPFVPSPTWLDNPHMVRQLVIPKAKLSGAWGILRSGAVTAVVSTNWIMIDVDTARATLLGETSQTSYCQNLPISKCWIELVESQESV